MKTTFDGLFSRLDMSKERISELLVISVKVSTIEKQTDKKMGGKTEHKTKDCETTKKDVTYV